MAVSIADAILLGLLQGFSEWLPVSSSGHLVIAQKLLGISAPAQFDIAIMAGTTLAIIAYYRKEIAAMAKGALSLEKKSTGYLMLIAAAGIPTAIIGFWGKKIFEGLFEDAFAVSLLLAVTGVFLLAANYLHKKSGKKPLSLAAALIVGTAHGVAIAPGISRSGATIGMAMILGIEQAQAAQFSFFIGAPAMAVASAVEGFSAQAAGVGAAELFAGCAAAFIAGYASIGFLLSILKKGRLDWFGYYCVFAGVVFALLTSGLV